MSGVGLAREVVICALGKFVVPNSRVFSQTRYSMGRWEKPFSRFVLTFPGAVGLFKYFAAFTEKVKPLSRRRFVAWKGELYVGVVANSFKQVSLLSKMLSYA